MSRPCTTAPHLQRLLATRQLRLHGLVSLKEDSDGVAGEGLLGAVLLQLLRVRRDVVVLQREVCHRLREREKEREREGTVLVKQNNLLPVTG